MTLGFDDVVGQQNAKLALELTAVDPTIGGVLLVGPPGSAKSTLARGLAALMGARFVELPLGVTEDRVKGSIDIQSALADAAIRVSDGLLVAADGGVLYVDEVNLLPDHIVDLVLDAAATGVNRLERDGLSAVQQARFSLVGTMNPEEGELRPQLLDRFAMVVAIEPLLEPEERRLALARNFGSAPAGADGFVLRVEEARERLLHIDTADAIDWVSHYCAQARVSSLRADVALVKAVAAYTALSGRIRPEPGDVELIAPLVIGHRRRQPPAAKEGRSGGERRGHAADREASSGREPSHAASSRDEDVEADGGEADGGEAGEADAGGDGVRESLRADRDPAVGLGEVELTRLSNLGDGEAGAETGTSSFSGEISMVKTILAHLESGAPGRLQPKDLRRVERSRREERCVVLAVDTSGSVASERAVVFAKSVIAELLDRAYQQRAQVAVVGFGGDGADVVLRPTRSLEVAASRLERLERGGRTPLAAGLSAALALCRELRQRHIEPLLVVLSDGRATAPASGDPVAAAHAVAGEVQRAKLDSVVVDLEQGGVRLGLARGLADELGALYLGGALSVGGH